MGKRRNGRIIGLDRREVAVETRDLDGRQLSGAALRQCGGADVPCQDVWIAVYAKRGFLLRIGGIIPGAGWKLNDAAPDIVSAAGQAEIQLARIEGDPKVKSSVWLWGVADNLRLGATNAVRIAEELLVVPA